MSQAAGPSGRQPVREEEPGAPVPGAPIPSTMRGPLAGLTDLATALRDPASAASTFVRGLTVGLLLGAAIVGSRLWRGRRRRRRA